MQVFWHAGRAHSARTASGRGTDRLDDGSRLEAYEHRWTRVPVHVGADGRCFRYDHGRAAKPIASEDADEYVQVARCYMLIAACDWSSARGSHWADGRVDRRIQSALQAAMNGRAFLVRPHEMDESLEWAGEPDDEAAA